MLGFNHGMILSIPRPQHGISPLEIDLELAYKAEAHLKDIATAGSGNALWLASVFSQGYGMLSRAYGTLCYEVASSTIAARKRRSILILDIAPKVAKEKGLASARSPTGSEDVREAICYADSDYTAIEEYRAALEAAKELVYIKLRAMQMGYDAVRAVIRGTSSSAGNRIPGTQDTVDTLIEGAMELVGSGPTVEHLDQEPCSSRVESSPVRKSRFGSPSL